MNAILKQAIDALAELPAEVQSELAIRFQDMVTGAQIDAKLAHSEARGGATPHDKVVAELRLMIATEYAG